MYGENLGETLEKEVKLCVWESCLCGKGKSGRVGGGEGGILLLNFSFSSWLMVVIVSPWLKFKTSPRIA